MTLNELIDDILLEARNNQITERVKSSVDTRQNCGLKYIELTY